MPGKWWKCRDCHYYNPKSLQNCWSCKHPMQPMLGNGNVSASPTAANQGSGQLASNKNANRFTRNRNHSKGPKPIDNSNASGSAMEAPDPAMDPATAEPQSSDVISAKEELDICTALLASIKGRTSAAAVEQRDTITERMRVARIVITQHKWSSLLSSKGELHCKQ